LPAANDNAIAGDHSNHFGLETEKIAGRDDAADAGAHSNRDIDRVEVGDGTKQFERVRGNALDLASIERRHEMHIALARHPMAFCERLIKISAKLDEGVRVIAGHREETAQIGRAHQRRTMQV